MKGLSLLMAILPMAPTPAAAQDRPDSVVARWVRAFQPALHGGDGGMRIDGVRGEGHVLIMRIELLPGVPAAMNPETVVSVLAGGMCADREGGTFFTGGRSVRAEITRQGVAAGIATIDHCPGPIGEGLTAATYAAAMQPMVGRPLGQGVTITGFRAEGATLVVSVDGPAGWRRALSQSALETAFLIGFCEGDRPDDSIFSDGLGVRIDATDGGRDLVQGRLITACPGSEGS